MDGRWKKIKEEVLGKKYDLSVVAADGKLMKKLNAAYRKKPKNTNVLSFPLSETEGEIFINLPFAEKEAKRAGLPEKDYADYLFVHSLLHLKGYGHGEKMKKEERKIAEKFKINVNI